MLDSRKSICIAYLSPEITARTMAVTVPKKTFDPAGLQSSNIPFGTVAHRLTYDEDVQWDDCFHSNCFAR